MDAGAGGPVAVVLAWQEAANGGDEGRLLALSDPAIAIVGPRGAAQGHEVLRDWLARAGAQFFARRVFAREGAVVVAQRGVWRDEASGSIVGDREVATAFRVADGVVTRLARHERLELALDDAGLGLADEVALPGA